MTSEVVYQYRELDQHLKIKRSERAPVRAFAFVVFDMFHDSYDPDAAHLDQKDLPVIGVYLSSKESVSFVQSGKIGRHLALLIGTMGVEVQCEGAQRSEEGPWSQLIAGGGPR